MQQQANDALCLQAICKRPLAAPTCICKVPRDAALGARQRDAVDLRGCVHGISRCTEQGLKDLNGEQQKQR